MKQTDLKINGEYCYKPKHTYTGKKIILLEKGLRNPFGGYYRTNKTHVRVSFTDLAEQESKIIAARDISSPWEEYAVQKAQAEERQKRVLAEQEALLEKNTVKHKSLPEPLLSMAIPGKYGTASLQKRTPKFEISLDQLSEIAKLIDPSHQDLAADMCQMCEVNHIVEGDYLCHGCRFG